MFILFHLIAKLDETGTQLCRKNIPAQSHLNQYQLQCGVDLDTKIMSIPCLACAHTQIHAYSIPMGDTLRKKHISRSLTIGQCD